MTDERIAALDAIGMIWSVPDYLFESYYAAAVQYHQVHGDLEVPIGYVDENGIRLGQLQRYVPHRIHHYETTESHDPCNLSFLRRHTII